jgi:flagellin-specific chaperone FliS
MSNFTNNPQSSIIINNLSNKLNIKHTYNISRDLLKTYEKVIKRLR